MNNSEHSLEPQQAGCVVVVDDNDDLRRWIVLTLDLAGLETLEAPTLLELQRILGRTRPDALVLDLQRSEADGLALLKRMRARPSLQAVPIVFLAASADEGLRRQALKAGADWFGLRPVGMLELQKRVTKLVRKGRRSRRAVAEGGRAASGVGLKLTG